MKSCLGQALTRAILRHAAGVLYEHRDGEILQRCDTDK